MNETFWAIRDAWTPFPVEVLVRVFYDRPVQQVPSACSDDMSEPQLTFDMLTSLLFQTLLHHIFDFYDITVK